MTRIPIFQRVPDHPSDENPPVEPLSPQSSEPRLPHPRRRITSQQFERNVRARQSTSSFHPVPSGETALAFSADSLEPTCQWNKVVVEVSSTEGCRHVNTVCHAEAETVDEIDFGVGWTPRGYTSGSSQVLIHLETPRRPAMGQESVE